jgi:hypothetical protein
MSKTGGRTETLADFAGTLVWSLLLACIFWAAALLADPPTVLFGVEAILGTLLILFPLSVYLALRFEWFVLRAITAAILYVIQTRDLQEKKWGILLKFLGGFASFHVAIALWRASGDDKKDLAAGSFIDLLAALVFLLPAILLLCAGYAGVIWAIREVTYGVSKEIAPVICDFLDSDRGELIFALTWFAVISILCAWGYVGSLMGGLLFLAICIGSAAVVGFCWWLFESDGPSRAEGKSMSSFESSSQELSTIGVPTVFDETRIVGDLQRIRSNPSLLGQYVVVLRSRFTSKREISLINQWTNQCKAGEQLILAQTGVMRAANEYRGLERENLQKSAETEATIAKHQADREEHVSRAEKAKVDRRLYNMEVEARLEAAKNPPQAESQPSQKQLRAKEKRACEARIKTLKREKANALEIEDEEERELKVYAIDETLRREMERWAKLL